MADNFNFSIPGGGVPENNSPSEEEEGSYKRLLGDKEITWFWLMQHYSKANAAAYKRQKEAKKQGKKQDSSSQTQPDQNNSQQGYPSMGQNRSGNTGFQQNGFGQQQSGFGQQNGFGQQQNGFVQQQNGFSQGGFGQQNGFQQSGYQQNGFSQQQVGFGQSNFGANENTNEENFGNTIVLGEDNSMFGNGSQAQNFWNQGQQQNGFVQQQGGFGQGGFGQQNGFQQSGYQQQGSFSQVSFGQAGFGQQRNFQQGGFQQDGFGQSSFQQDDDQDSAYPETSQMDDDYAETSQLDAEDMVLATLFRVSNGRTIEIRKVPFILGRNPKVADCLLSENTNVSGNHATIGNIGGTFYIEDNKSKNGVFLNGIRISPGEKIQIIEGTVIELGDEKLIFHA